MTGTQIDHLLAAYQKAPPERQKAFTAIGYKQLEGKKWAPLPGPQTEAFLCKADVLLYGGEAGPGKTDLLLGLAFQKHKRSLIMRRQYVDMGAMVERAIEINGTREGYNGSAPMKLRPNSKQLIEFGAAAKLGDEQHWKGQPHDFLGFDEVVDFLEAQVRFLMGWVRAARSDPSGEDQTGGQRRRTVMATNPPITADGQWVIPMFRPWLDITHANPAKHGELRWFVTDPDGEDMEVDGPTPIDLGGKKVIPKSRTFIPGHLSDNPYLAGTGYEAELDAMPEPMRSAYRDGNFMAARKDDVNQVIPSAWVAAAQSRWREIPPEGIPMCAMGCDASGGGDDPMILAPRYDGWFAELVEVPGKEIPRDAIGKYCTGIIVANRRDMCPIVVDMGGGYGGPIHEVLSENNIPVIPYVGATTQRLGRTKDRALGFHNKRSQALWQFREALDPDQDGGSPIALPPDPMLMADLTTPTFEVGPRGITVETKKQVMARLGRSTDKGDAVIISWQGGDRHLMSGRFTPRRRGAKPQVITKKTQRQQKRRMR